jgi:prepilin-type processing-associated H-X9-DG protein
MRITDITDGTSTTLLLGERSTHYDPLWKTVVDNYFASRGLPALDWPFDDLTSYFYTAWYNETLGLVDSGLGLPMNWRVPSVTTNYTDLYQYGKQGYGSNHPGGANFAFCDGSVRFVGNSASTTMIGNITLLDALSTCNGGEVIPGDF